MVDRWSLKEYVFEGFGGKLQSENKFTDRLPQHILEGNFQMAIFDPLKIENIWLTDRMVQMFCRLSKAIEDSSMSVCESKIWLV